MQAGAVVHAASHFKSRGGCETSHLEKQIASYLLKEVPRLAIYNADSRMYFAVSFLALSYGILRKGQPVPIFSLIPNLNSQDFIVPSTI